tara:strand:+ start:2396 stop:2905 length:510 start_codon:yes stop_codon:yes gene_type:complete
MRDAEEIVRNMQTMHAGWQILIPHLEGTDAEYFEILPIATETGIERMQSLSSKYITSIGGIRSAAEVLISNENKTRLEEVLVDSYRSAFMMGTSHLTQANIIDGRNNEDRMREIERIGFETEKWINESKSRILAYFAFDILSRHWRDSGEERGEEYSSDINSITEESRP